LEELELRANPSVFTVDDDGAQNPNAGFTSIQAAINAASAGDKIHVYAGTYDEQVIIPSSLNNLELKAIGAPNSVKIAPTSFTADPLTEAIVHVAGAQNVKISGFVISGEAAPSGTAAGANYGVLVDLGGSAKISGNHITTIRDLPLTGVQEGIGIQFGFTDSNGSILSGGTGEATQNTIDDYQKGGVVVIGAASNATVKQNVITGLGPTDVIGQNGVQVSHGADALVVQNTITDNDYTGPGFVSTGILVYQSDNVEISNNNLSGNNEGIFLFEANNNDVHHNTANNNTDDGIVLYFANGNSVRHNVASFNGIDGIVLDTANNNVVEFNSTFGNGLYGIAVEANSTGNTVRFNKLGDNVVGDLFIGNVNNTVSKNQIF
jgi:parallel beta-helix repeat protein